ncbi:Agno [Scorpion polyomavirus 2]|nr:Agno [Scorpion polyomavirus 2]QTH80127.1 Agno [Scorpion polyomavirus 2]QTH80132.1 Agno [Scorpion polyomavirus 2]
MDVYVLNNPNMSLRHLRTISIGCQCYECRTKVKPTVLAPEQEITAILKAILENILALKGLEFMTHTLCSVWRYNLFLRTQPDKADIRWLFKKVSNGSCGLYC